MAELRHTANELKQMQSLPLDIKIRMSCRRIQEWYDYWEGDVYVSFSGGKDSTVLMDLVRNQCGLKDVPIVFIDTGLEFPEIKEFAKRYATEILRPKKSFKEILTDVGYPVISKDVALKIEYAKKYLNSLTECERKRALAPITQKEQLNDYVFDYGCLRKVLGIETNDGKRKLPTDQKNKSVFDCSKYKYLLDADFLISNRCCYNMKKAPAHHYDTQTKRKPMVGTMADESFQRRQAWMRTGCNAFNTTKKSAPLSFWTEQDILQYIKENNIEICSVYGDIQQDENNQYYTTGCNRTGCVFCMFGCHLEKEPNRFQGLKETHPKLYDYCINGGEYNEDGVWQPSKDGLGIGHVLDFIGVNYK